MSIDMPPFFVNLEQCNSGEIELYKFRVMFQGGFSILSDQVYFDRKVATEDGFLFMEYVEEREELKDKLIKLIKESGTK